MTGQDLADRALALVGTRYRLHGRDPETGLDCLGLLVAALGRELPVAYGLRMARDPDLDDVAAGAGLEPVACDLVRQPGDVVLLRPGPGQLHVAIMADAVAAIHAHAGLRRVVVGPLRAHWPVVAAWRLTCHERNA